MPKIFEYVVTSTSQSTSLDVRFQVDDSQCEPGGALEGVGAGGLGGQTGGVLSG